MRVSGEHTFAEAFVELADTLVADFDVVDFLHVLTHRSVELLDVQAAGIILADQRGRLRVMASSSERARLLELFEVETDEGPCLECFRTGHAVTDTGLDDPGSRWPRLGNHARAVGFRSVHALPMRLRDDVIGALNLFSVGSHPLTASDAGMGQALADVATIGLLQQRAIQDRQILAEQLQGALNSRVVIEQAKGVLAERLGIDVHEAFDALRAYARHHNVRLSDLAQHVVEDIVDTEALTGFTRRT